MRKAPSAGIMTKKMIASILFCSIDSFQKAVFVKAGVLGFKVCSQVVSNQLDCLVLCDGCCDFFAQAFAYDFSDCGEVLFSHVVILIDFVVSVKLFSQVFCDLGRGCNLQSACVKQASLSVMMSMGLVSLVTDNAVDCVAAHPELAFLWCLVFHS